MKKFLLPALAIGLLFSSCSIEKRHYRPGYHIEWHHKGGTQDVKDEAVKTAAPEKDISEVSRHADVPEQAGQKNAAPVTPDAPVSLPATGYLQQEMPLQSHAVSKADKMVMQDDNLVEETGVPQQEQETLAPADTHASTPVAPASRAAKGVLILLAIFIPWLAVGIVTDWGIEVVWNLLWSLTCIGGIIHAIIVVNREY